MQSHDFTDRVRKILAMARDAAARLRDNQVRPEHLLLGVISEGEGVAVAVLVNFNVDLTKLSATLGLTALLDPASVTGNIPYSAESRAVLERAVTEARELGHSYAGTEHLLLGILDVKATAASRALEAQGVTAPQARAEVLRLLGFSPPASSDAPPAVVTSRDSVARVFALLAVVIAVIALILSFSRR